MWIPWPTNHPCFPESSLKLQGNCWRVAAPPPSMPSPRKTKKMQDICMALMDSPTRKDSHFIHVKCMSYPGIHSDYKIPKKHNYRRLSNGFIPKIVGLLWERGYGSNWVKTLVQITWEFISMQVIIVIWYSFGKRQRSPAIYLWA